MQSLRMRLWGRPALPVSLSNCQKWSVGLTPFFLCPLNSFAGANLHRRTCSSLSFFLMYMSPALARPQRTLPTCLEGLLTFQYPLITPISQTCSGLKGPVPQQGPQILDGIHCHGRDTRLHTLTYIPLLTSAERANRNPGLDGACGKGTAETEMRSWPASAMVKEVGMYLVDW